MRRVTGIGGIFFRCEDPAATREWYGEHLGVESGEHGANFEWRHANSRDRKGFTVWGPFPAGTEYFGPGEQPFMINYRVRDLEGLLSDLREAGVEIVGEPEEYEYGTFAWIRDPDGRKVELWEPRDGPYEEMLGQGDRNASS